MQAGEPRRAEGGRKEHTEPRWYISGGAPRGPAIILCSWGGGPLGTWLTMMMALIHNRDTDTEPDTTLGT